MPIKVSVIVPTYNRSTLLQKNLDSLINQNISNKKSYEIIVCDDGSCDNTANMVQDLAKSTKDNPPIHYVSQSNQGPAAARNLGIKISTGEIIALTDDDCETDSDWIEQIVKSFDSHPDIVGVGGVTYSIPEKITPLTHQIENVEPWSFPTCNLAYRAKIISEVGGFDPSFLFTNEDADISWRIEKQGQVIHNPKMKISHPPRKTTFIKQLHTIVYFESEFILQEKMPEEYKRRRINPYREILFVHGIKIGAKRLIKNAKYIGRYPMQYIELIALIIMQRIYLIYLMPGFIFRHAKRS